MSHVGTKSPIQITHAHTHTCTNSWSTLASLALNKNSFSSSHSTSWQNQITTAKTIRANQIYFNVLWLPSSNKASVAYFCSHMIWHTITVTQWPFSQACALVKGELFFSLAYFQVEKCSVKLATHQSKKKKGLDGWASFNVAIPKCICFICFCFFMRVCIILNWKAKVSTWTCCKLCCANDGKYWAKWTLVPYDKISLAILFYTFLVFPFSATFKASFSLFN